MTKITWQDVCNIFSKHNEDNNITSQFGDPNRINAVVVFKASNWPDKAYPLESRSYRVASDNKRFIGGMGGNSAFAESLDGTDSIRLDWYLGQWKIDYCYIEGGE